ncbi:hypothetical protein GCM10010387_62860 [Streptomyces inusitatus]|uniref:Uncharacterized protein n=1 Tax=Streptomyces inusitatus TaxID=68221 RepID=A0A918QMX6_9ACTN|nr:hypothetical protein GCM10010387_62860 [Streptomyces inusitatus]
MTGEVLPVLWSVITEEERETYPEQLEAFVGRYRERLVRLYAEYGPHSVVARYGRPGPLQDRVVASLEGRASDGLANTRASGGWLSRSGAGRGADHIGMSLPRESVSRRRKDLR